MNTSVEPNSVKMKAYKLSGAWQMYISPKLPKSRRPVINKNSAPNHRGESSGAEGTPVIIRHCYDLVRKENEITFTLHKGGMVQVGDTTQYCAGGGDTYVTIRATNEKFD
ncbi:hypothetical protein [Shimazuella alba]|uniref:Uncharacterized protein n=1 Tax=Shimazuella alba TaxID=2690964 RepID=A0A6I4VUD9_9BACL|nr:hypothetical protein [Shimazuella alba]MXQ55429.1 hypothetical protein [Shimazuella alba]